MCYCFAMTEVLRHLVNIMFLEAKIKWPSLTWKTFHETFQEVMAEHTGPISLQDMAIYLNDRLEKKINTSGRQ